MCFQSQYSYLENFKCSWRAVNVARGPDVAQAYSRPIEWSKYTPLQVKIREEGILTTFSTQV